jgi:Flp pilus assembly protein TadG
VAVEGAVVYPAFFTLVFMLVIGGMGAFHYQTVSRLASEAARFACVRGQSWAKETKLTSPTQQQILEQCVLPAAIGMDWTCLALSVTVIDPSTGSSTPWDSSTKATNVTSANGVTETNRVHVIVTYAWFPGLYVVGPFTMSAVAELPMAY